MRPRTLFLVFLLVELASLTAYFFPTLNTVGFFAIAGTALVLSLRRLEYGLYFVVADLILGGKSGALFSFEYSGFFLSLRMALFIVVMAVWITKLFSAKKLTIVSFFAEPTLRWWGVFGLTVVWGVVVGIARGNDFGNLFLDANGYFYGALILPFWWVLERSKGLSFNGVKDSPLLTVFFVATTLLAFKTLFAVYWFTHAGNNLIAANLLDFYRWVRDTGVGEITWIEGNFARVFFQSHVFNIAAFFVLLTMGEKLVKGWSRWGLLTLNSAVILVSLSRSFWVGVTVGLAALLISPIGLTGPIRLISRIGRIGKAAVGSGVLAVLLILAVARFPLPPPSAFDFGAATRSRLAAEAAATSRWNLLPPLWKAVREHPVVGSGFGRAVTYISNDPRIRSQSPTGEYTTYALEWGWLDFWLKLGLVGLIGPIGLIGILARRIYKARNQAGLAVLAALALIHVFTPYLNHPLGLGVLALLTALPMYDIVDQRGFETSSRVSTQRA